jgi:hypothetical protein
LIVRLAQPPGAGVAGGDIACDLARLGEYALDFRCGSKADVTLLNFDVRFTPNSGHSLAATSISAKGHKATSTRYSITSSARTSNEAGMVIPMALAVLRLISKSNFGAK